MIGWLSYFRAALRMRALRTGAEPRGRDDVICAYRLRARDRRVLRGKVANTSARAAELAERDVRVLFGEPQGTLLLLDAVEHATGRPIREVWPRWRGFVHGGVDFRPYERVYRRRVGGGIVFVETYATPEGRLLAVQDRPGEASLAVVAPLQVEAETGQTVRLPETGDTVRFVGERRMVVEGRAGLNAFGERLRIEELESAVEAAATAHGCGVPAFAVWPEFPHAHESRGRHTWFLEFDVPPADLRALGASIDAALQHGNASYAAQRRLLRPPHVRLVRSGTFGSHDFPRVVNEVQAGLLR